MAMPKGSIPWNKKNIDESKLVDLYFNDGYGSPKLSAIYGLDAKTIRTRLSKYGKLRSNSEAHKGQIAWNYKGEIITREGYVRVRLPINSPFISMIDKYGYVFKHRLVMAEYLGRCLEDKETVHHIDGDKSNNYINNLEIYLNHSEHMKCHLTSDEARRRGAMKLYNHNAARAALEGE